VDCHGQLNALYVCLLMGHRLSLTFADSWIMTVCEWVSLWLFHQLKLHSDRLMSACENGFNLVCSGFMIGLIVAFQWIMHIYCMYIYIHTHPSIYNILTALSGKKDKKTTKTARCCLVAWWISCDQRFSEWRKLQSSYTLISLLHVRWFYVACSNHHVQYCN
jgi:hypothetical protein